MLALRDVRRRVFDPPRSRAAVLRQCDWRFLLPTPPGGIFEHLVLLGAPSGLAELIVSAGVARRVSERVPADRCADGLIILHRSTASLKGAARCLLAQAVAYWEVDRRRFRRALVSVEAARRTLRSAGLSDIAAYWVRPGFTNAQVYLPMGDEAVLRWYLKTLVTSTTLKGRALELVLRGLSALGSSLQQRLVPVFAMTASFGTQKTSPSILGNPEIRRDLWRSVRRPRGSGRISDLELLLLTGGVDDWNRVVAMPFPPGGQDPLAVLKLSRVADRNVHTEREQKALTEIRAVVDADMRRTLPEGFGTFFWKDLTVGMESYVSGRVLAATSARWGNSLSRKVDDLDRAVGWLIEFDRQTESRRVEWGGAELAEWSTRPLDCYEAIFGLTPGERSLFDKARQRHRELAGSTFPIVWYHYAFSSWNICRQNDDIGVFDWESAERGPALFDLIYLVFRWHQEIAPSRGKNGHLRSFRELFLTDPNGSAASRAIQGAVRRYMEALRIDPRTFPLALVALWALHANTRADRAQRLALASSDIRRGNVYVSYLGALAEHPDRLFQQW